ncbi:MAG: AI-2E family transporter [Elusimicrobiota bacterium]
MLKLDKNHLFNIFFVGIMIVLLYNLLKIISPFLSPIFVAVVFSVVYYPFNITLRKKTGNNNAAAVLCTASVILTVILPLAVFGWLLLKESKEIYPKTLSYINDNSSLNLTIQLPSFMKSESLDLKEIGLKNIEQIQDKIIKSGTKVLKNIFFFLVDFFVMIFTLFFLFREGDKFLKWVVEIIPMDSSHIYTVLNQFYITVIAITKGLLLTAAAQGAAAGLGYYAFGAPSPILLGTLTSFGALIPFIGTSVIWAPVAIGMFFFKSHTAGILVALWGFFVVGLLDNFLRPLLIGKEAKLPFFMLFLGLFGGLRIYGPMGLFVGPILVSMVATFLQIYKEHLKTRETQK